MINKDYVNRLNEFDKRQSTTTAKLQRALKRVGITAAAVAAGSAVLINSMSNDATVNDIVEYIKSKPPVTFSYPVANRVVAEMLYDNQLSSVLLRSPFEQNRVIVASSTNSEYDPVRLHNNNSHYKAYLNEVDAYPDTNGNIVSVSNKLSHINLNTEELVNDAMDAFDTFEFFSVDLGEFMLYHECAHAGTKNEVEADIVAALYIARGMDESDPKKFITHIANWREQGGDRHNSSEHLKVVAKLIDTPEVINNVPATALLGLAVSIRKIVDKAVEANLSPDATLASVRLLFPNPSFESPFFNNNQSDSPNQSYESPFFNNNQSDSPNQSYESPFLNNNQSDSPKKKKTLKYDSI